MFHTGQYAGGGAVAEGTVRTNWLKAMYAANVAVSGSIGVAALVAPEATSALLGIPGGDPLNYGIATGSVPLAFGVAGVLGLRSPLRLSPVLGLQVVYKSLFLVGVVAPLAVAGRVPEYAFPVVGIFAFFVVGDLIALPFPYVLSTTSGERG